MIGKQNVWRQPSVKLLDKPWVHELILVGDVEADDLFPVQGFRKLATEPVQMGFLHTEDDVCPTQMSFRDNDASTWLRADRTNLISRKSFEQLFGRQTTAFIPATDEKELLDGCVVHRKSGRKGRRRH